MARKATLWVGLTLMLSVGLKTPRYLAQEKTDEKTVNTPPAEEHKYDRAQTCDSLNNPVPGESIVDASKRIQAWKKCLANANALTDALNARLVRKVEVNNGRLTFTVLPRLAVSPPDLVRRMDIYVLNSSPLGYRYILTIGCGTWTKTVSGSIDGSTLALKLDHPSSSFDLPSPCKLSDAILEEVREAEGTNGPDPKPSIRPGVDDTELARRLNQVVTLENGSSLPTQTKRSVTTQTNPEPDYAAAKSTDTGPGAIYSWTQLENGDLISDWKTARTIEVYQGQVSFEDSILASPDGVVKDIEVEIINSSPRRLSVKFTLRCGDWNTSATETVEPLSILFGPTIVKRTRYFPSGHSYTGYDVEDLVYKPTTPCHSVTLEVRNGDIQGTD